MTDGEHEYGLVMPFVVCKSNGGVYDDASFVAGAHMADINNRCKWGEDPVESYVPTPLTQQLDLVAMRHGYVMSSEPWWEHPDEWTFVRLEKVEKL